MVCVLFCFSATLIIISWVSFYGYINILNSICFKDRFSSHGPGCPGTYYVVKSSLKLKRSACLLPMLQLRVCTTTLGLPKSFKGTCCMSIFNLFKRFAANRYLFPVFITVHAFILWGRGISCYWGLSQELRNGRLCSFSKFCAYLWTQLLRGYLRGRTAVS